MYTAYALYNKTHRKIYIGQTKNIEDRVRLHNNKTFKKGCTARYNGIWDLIYKESVLNRKEALKREKQLKSYQGREFIKKFIPL